MRISVLLYFTMAFSFLINLPIIVASTPLALNLFITFFTFAGGTASVILSCDSETQISQGYNPLYLRGTFSRLTIKPPLSFAISPIDDDNPPAPLSVMLE